MKKNDQLQDNVSEVDKDISIKDDETQETEIQNETKKVDQSVEDAKIESFEIKSYEAVDKENYETIAINSVRDIKTPPKVEALTLFVV